MTTDPRPDEIAQKAFSEFVGRSQPHFGAAEWWGYHDAVVRAIESLSEAGRVRESALAAALADLVHAVEMMETVGYDSHPALVAARRILE